MSVLLLLLLLLLSPGRDEHDESFDFLILFCRSVDLADQRGGEVRHPPHPEAGGGGGGAEAGARHGGGEQLLHA